jgi:hypothetical protein
MPKNIEEIRVGVKLTGKRGNKRFLKNAPIIIDFM